MTLVVPKAHVNRLSFLSTVNSDPSSFAKYASNPKVMKVLDKLKGMGLAG